MKWLYLALLIFSSTSCSNETKNNVAGDVASIVIPDFSIEDGDAITDIEEELPYSIFTDPCVECSWYFCPPLDEIWQKQICINKCDIPPTVVHESACLEYLECDPSQSIIEIDLECLTTDGFPGVQNKLCDKGQIKYSDCETPCAEESCDGLDNDCDESVDEGFAAVKEECNNIDDNCNGLVDEGSWVCDLGCGEGLSLCIAGEFLCMAPEPHEEVCNGEDDDCDGETDEDQLNACLTCGLVPVEECNGIDDNCDGQTDEGLISPCNSVCGEGYQTCIAGNWVSCNAPVAFEEICDGLDNDCDGAIDEDLQCTCTIQDLGVLFPCQDSPLVCGQGFKTCECLEPDCKIIVTTECFAPCYWLAQPIGSDPLCDPTNGSELQSEKCNNFDDNCNQLIDEGLTTACYTGEEGTVNVGICIPGEAVCVAGVWGAQDPSTGLFTPNLCAGEMVPQPEICDGEDNDCDGETDWGGELKDTDILFILDWSGSMAEEQNAVLIALNQFAGTYSDESVLQWGIVLGPRQSPSPWSKDILELYHNLTGFTDFLSSMSLLDLFTMSGGYEMLLDAIYLSIQNISALLPKSISDLEWVYPSVGESIPHHDDFIIDWRANADRIIIVFSDEKPQSYLKNFVGTRLNIPDVSQAAVNTPNLKIYVFSSNTIWMWDELAQDTGGKYYSLSNSPTAMYNSLMEIFEEVCKQALNYYYLRVTRVP